MSDIINVVLSFPLLEAHDYLANGIDAALTLYVYVHILNAYSVRKM